METVPHPTGDHAAQELAEDAAGELLTLQRAAYLSEARAHDDFDLPPLVETLEEIRAHLAADDVVVLGVREQGRLVGSVRLHRVGRTVELGRLIVAPDRQGHGIGTFLLRAAEDAFPDTEEIRLFTGEHSTANIRLYVREGYTETGRTSAGDYDLVHFAKALDR